MIKKFDYNTPGRNGDIDKTMMLLQNLLDQQVLEQVQRSSQSYQHYQPSWWTC